jgi:hypothetical protein
VLTDAGSIPAASTNTQQRPQKWPFAFPRREENPQRVRLQRQG